MHRKIMPVQIADEYVRGDGVTVGAAGSHDDVALRLTFSPMWEGTTRSIVWKDALGGNPTVTILGTDLLETGETEVYIVPIPAEPKTYAGDMTMTIKGVTAAGEREKTATLSATAHFIILESDWDDDAVESGDLSPTQAEQMQAQIDNIKDTIAEAKESATAAKDSEMQAGELADAAAASAEAANAAKEEAEEAEERASSAALRARQAMVVVNSAAEEELRRVDAEEARKDAERKRTAAEEARAAAEIQREDTGNGIVAQAASSADRAETAARSAEETVERLTDLTSSEEWIFELEDGTSVTKRVVLNDA